MDEPTFTPEFAAEYEILEVVGAGGMARVYKARQRRLNRDVAIKLLAPQAFSEEDSRKRFEREREVTAGLKHPNIVPLLSYGDNGGRPYLVFEFIDGPSLRDVLLQKGRLPLVRSLRTAKQIALGLAHAHAAGVVHRDLKPDNVLIGTDDEARVCDFGLARPIDDPSAKKLTQTGIILGTPGYLAPEAIRGEDVTPAADMFSLGVMLFEMITGSLPFDGGSEHETLVRYLREDLPPISSKGFQVPQRVERIVAGLVRRDVTQRYQDAAKVAEALAVAEAKGEAGDGPATRERPRSQGGGRSTSASNPGVISRQRDTAPLSLTPRSTPSTGARFIRRYPLATAATAAMVLALVVGGIAGTFFLATPPPAPKVVYQVVGKPQTLAGVTAASIRWQTLPEVPTALWIWREGQPDSEGKAVRPPKHAPTGGTQHELTVRGLDSHGRWTFNVLFPDGSRSGVAWSFDLAADVANLVKDPACEYAGAGAVKFSFRVEGELTPGLALDSSAGEGQPVWAPKRGLKDVSITVPLPEPRGEYTPVVRFRELDDPDGVRATANRTKLPAIPGPEALRRALIAAWDDPKKPLKFHPVMFEVMRSARRVFEMAPGKTPDRRQVEELSERKRADLLAVAWQNARQKLLEQKPLLDLDLLKSAVPLWMNDPDLKDEERRITCEAVMRLSDLDGASQLVAGTALLDVDKLLKIRVAVLPGEEKDPAAFRPLASIADPELSSVVKRVAYPIFQHLNWASDPGVVALFDSASQGASEVIEATRKLAIEDKADPEHKRGMWLALPDLPPNFKTDGPLRIAMRLASFAPDYRLWLRIGESAKVMVRPSLAEFGGFVSVPLRPTRVDIDKAAFNLALELPAGYVERDARKLAIRLELFPTREDDHTMAPMTSWLLEMAIRAK